MSSAEEYVNIFQFYEGLLSGHGVNELFMAFIDNSFEKPDGVNYMYSDLGIPQTYEQYLRSQSILVHGSGLVQKKSEPSKLNTVGLFP
ncbi:hypothetical protein [Deminuibacter soli]|uniref:Uncharacterized protein n=1 Tax=Deminuibacter soli TaxID=2291815 RepID=A0A3E1NJ08_9BACT|nr:hypothetical protein [Deminuibacter soli]RFM27923.1 hypothetical protein DXN05_10270 [Deminuibacter soli]